MSIFSRIAIGTASWDPEGYGHRNVTCPREEQEKIIGYCQSCGIDTIHTKAAYNVDLSWLPTCFEVIESDVPPNYSFYDPKDSHNVMYPSPHVVQVPYSPFNREWEDTLKEIASWCDGPEIHVRSVFVQSKVFTSNEPVFKRFRDYAQKRNLPVGTLCILFCLLNPHVDKVVIGVDSEEQLRDNLRFFHRMDGFGVDDPEITDPRTWSK